MGHRSLLPDDVEQYVQRKISRESEAQRRLREETAVLPGSNMQIGTDQAALMALLVKSINARRAIEVGTFTGYSALSVAAALPEGGLLIACDVDEEWTKIAK